MPRVEVIDVSDRLIGKTDDLRVEFSRSLYSVQQWRQLASLYAGEMTEAGICDYIPTMS